MLTLPNSLLFVATFIFLRPLIVLSYVFSEYNGVSTRDGLVPSGGYLTTEGWSCGLRDLEETDELCLELRTARYLLIPFLIFATVLFGMAAREWWMSWRREREGEYRLKVGK